MMNAAEQSRGIRQPENSESFWRKLGRSLKNDKYLYLMFLPPLLYYLIFCYLPIYGVTLAFKDFNINKGIWGSPYVGLKYINQFIYDPYFWQVVGNTIVLSLLNLVWGFPVPIILALLLNEVRVKFFKKTVQTVSYLPHFISTVVVCGMLTSFLSTDGIVNTITGFFGAQPVAFLSEAKYFRSIYVISEIWQTAGWSSIIYLGALSSIDVQQYEAAIIDGANRWQQMVHVTIPGLLPQICILFILNTGKIMEVAYQKVLLLLTGNNMAVGDVISTYVYRRGILGADFSYSTGVGLFQSLLGMLFLILTNYIMRRVSETSLW